MNPTLNLRFKFATEELQNNFNSNPTAENYSQSKKWRLEVEDDIWTQQSTLLQNKTFAYDIKNCHNAFVGTHAFLSAFLVYHLSKIPYKAYKTDDIVNHTMMRVALWVVDMNVNRIQLEYEEVWIKSQITKIHRSIENFQKSAFEVLANW